MENHKLTERSANAPAKDTIRPRAATEKPHYELLDGLRGVAAMMVIWYHLFEGFATSPVDQHFNHGYLAVDFFFVLSGFVIGYAYDDRWDRMTLSDFFRRRLIRLHPMVIVGVLLGTVAFCLQGCVQWDGTPVPWSSLAVGVLLSLLMLPTLPGSRFDVRGNGEMFPLNGPTWSLFFEYIGNIAYALCLRRLSTRNLALVVLLSALGYAGYAIGNGSGFYNMGVGWTLADNNLPGGLLRLSFGFSAGLLLSRLFMARQDQKQEGKALLLNLPLPSSGCVFLLCSLVVCCVFSLPYIGYTENSQLSILNSLTGSAASLVEEFPSPWNGLYDAVCTLVLFPLVVWLAASARPYGVKTKPSGLFSYLSGARVCKFLGDISYPLYVVHYPSMYLFYAWLWGKESVPPFADVWPVAVALFVGNIGLAWLWLKWYDLPVRRWLQSK